MKPIESKKVISKIAKKATNYNDFMRKLGVTVNGHYLKKLKEQLKEYKIPFQSFRPHPELKENIFKTINTKEKSYWLGFLAADGYIPIKKHSVRINISKKDEELIDSFIAFVGANKNYKRSRINKHGKEMISIEINNKNFSNHIKNKGIISPKSHKNVFIDFKNEKLDLAYFMGFYDGDGSSQRPVIYSGCKKTLLEFKKKYKIINKISKRKNKWGQCYSLNFGVNLLKKILSNYKNSLKRKRLKDKTLQPVGNIKKRTSKINCNKEQLTLLINLFPLTEIARFFNVSDVAVKKRCKALKIKTKNRLGYWSTHKKETMPINFFLK